ADKIFAIAVAPANMDIISIDWIDGEDDGDIQTHFLTIASTCADGIIAGASAFVGRSGHGVFLLVNPVERVFLHARDDNAGAGATRLFFHITRQAVEDDG